MKRFYADRKGTNQEDTVAIPRELIEAFAKAIGLGQKRKPETERQRRLAGLSKRTQNIIIKTIEVSPALEEAILTIAELSFQDGQDYTEEIS